ncbi:MAG: hypothetical protein OEV30_09405 [Ignavibacteria bacterium]|nr:hypothetical protein [Ignavibacteria bacterium]
MTISTALRKKIDACVAARGATVVDIVVRGEARLPVLEIFVDNLEGITLALCRDLNKDLQPIFDDEIPGGRYRLEVSSPGLDRPLRFPWQFRKHVGKLVEVTLPSEGPPVIKDGRLTGLSDDGITIEETSSKKEEVLAFKDIVSAKIRPPW